MQILVVVTGGVDPTADPVVVELLRRQVSVFPVDARAMLTGTPSIPGGDGCSLAEPTSPQPRPLAEVRSVWWPAPRPGHRDWRRLPRWSARVTGTCPEHGQTFLPRDTGIRWCNHPRRVAEADQLPRQLAAATRCGLRVPETLITSDPGTAAAFCSLRAGSGVVYRSVPDAPAAPGCAPCGLPGASADGAGGRTRTHLFQAAVPAARSVRITVVGRRAFGVAVDHEPGFGGRHDWHRPAHHLPYRPVTVPGDVAAAVVEMVDTLGLTCAASDWAVTPGGQWYFLELDPTWSASWTLADQVSPLVSALADALTDEYAPAGAGR
ncbi:hypothetical protein C1701_24320 [Actinoalloteichus sp. AHMU CJ021]|uniref:ATP-grasp ribosomal peptide maturase n=1 Tax=Actinoalloteichus caeruleus DSM 43889 TaxID=1120930 RepID=A0ABT1JD92_ACTCY|nr:hypothetical protein [Actinoalloteichus caeruleus]AUS80947.1 hypothetical protein C1701_24320 [Actinoalloteichus sp. AHMU CJ021]MCP2330393.1 hypothetical protein [Actinoalloteichus caeruleus DSM 43889]